MFEAYREGAKGGMALCSLTPRVHAEARDVWSRKDLGHIGHRTASTGVCLLVQLGGERPKRKMR